MFRSANNSSHTLKLPYQRSIRWVSCPTINFIRITVASERSWCRDRRCSQDASYKNAPTKPVFTSVGRKRRQFLWQPPIPIGKTQAMLCWLFCKYGSYRNTAVQTWEELRNVRFYCNKKGANPCNFPPLPSIKFSGKPAWLFLYAALHRFLTLRGDDHIESFARHFF